MDGRCIASACWQVRFACGRLQLRAGVHGLPRFVVAVPACTALLPCARLHAGGPATLAAVCSSRPSLWSQRQCEVLLLGGAGSVRRPGWRLPYPASPASSLWPTAGCPGAACCRWPLRSASALAPSALPSTPSEARTSTARWVGTRWAARTQGRPVDGGCQAVGWGRSGGHGWGRPPPCAGRLAGRGS